jgi:hypothetical protein
MQPANNSRSASRLESVTSFRILTRSCDLWMRFESRSRSSLSPIAALHVECALLVAISRTRSSLCFQPFGMPSRCSEGISPIARW